MPTIAAAGLTLILAKMRKKPERGGKSDDSIASSEVGAGMVDRRHDDHRFCSALSVTERTVLAARLRFIP
jgi:hypothetical protein